MVESNQSKLEQEVSAIDALEVLLRIGNSREKESILVHIYDHTAVYERLEYLEKEGYIEKINITSCGDHDIYNAPFTQKGREIYERIKREAPHVFKGELFFIVNPPTVTADPFAHHYELAPEEEEGEELEVKYDTYFGRTQEELEKDYAWIKKNTEVDNALRSMVEGVYTLFHEHSELNPKSVLGKYREDFESIAQKILQEK